MRDGLAETELLIQSSGQLVIGLSIVSKQMILDGARGKNGSSILGITDKHCWTEAGALGDT